MFIRKKGLLYNAKPSKPDPIMARRLQELLGGQWGEMTGMTSYLFQAWNSVGHDDYKDLLLDTGTEEIGHIEMIATMIAHLLEDAPLNVQENIYKNADPALGAVMGGMDPNHAIVNGLGSNLTNPNGVPWTAAYMNSSGNLLADMRYNLTRESMGRLQVTRLYHMTEDKGIRDMLSYLMARETQHQMQFAQAVQELEEKYGPVVPHDTDDLQNTEFAHTLYNFSEGEDSKAVVDGKTAKDGVPFKYDSKPHQTGGDQIVPLGPDEVRNTQGQDVVKEGRKIIEDMSKEDK